TVSPSPGTTPPLQLAASSQKPSASTFQDTTDETRADFFSFGADPASSSETTEASTKVPNELVRPQTEASVIRSAVVTSVHPVLSRCSSRSPVATSLTHTNTLLVIVAVVDSTKYGVACVKPSESEGPAF